MPRVTDASTVEQLDQVRALMRAFIRWHRLRHHEDIELIDAYFDAVVHFRPALGRKGGKVRDII